MVQNLSTIKSRISPYERKILELRGLVAEEAKKLQNVIESKDSALKAVREAGEEKSRIERLISKITQDQKEAEEALLETISRKTKFIESSKSELKREQTALEDTRLILTETSQKVSELMPVVKELEIFITKESDARERFLQAETIFHTSKEKAEKIISKIETEKSEIEEKRQSFEGFKTYVSNLYGKLASYVKVAEQTIEYVNQTLAEKGTPIQFEIPSEEIINISINDFDKKL